MPAPDVTPHRVGKNAVVSIDDVVARQASGSVNKGGGTDTQTYPDGFDRQAATNHNASGDLTVIIEFGEEVELKRGQYINLLIEEPTNKVYDGVAFVSEITDSFANDGGWTYSFNWTSHGVFEPYPADYTPPPPPPPPGD